MTETAQVNFAMVGKQMVAFGDSTTTYAVTGRLLTDGTTQASENVNYVDSAVIPLSTAVKASLGLVGTQYLDAGLTASTVAVATTTTRGLVKVDDNASGNPIAITTVGTLAGRIPTAAQDAGLDGTTYTPSATNPFTTMRDLRTMLALCGSGKDGYGQLGAISFAGTAPTVASGSAGLLTGTYTYKLAPYNLSGATAASTASASTGSITNGTVVITPPSLPSGSMGWRVYRSTDGVNYYLVYVAVNGWNWFSGDTITDNYPYPNTSLTAPSSDTTGNSATLSGKFEFISFTLGASQTITVANSGNYAGILDIRWQTTASLNATSSIVGTSANRVQLAQQMPYARVTSGTVPGMLNFVSWDPSTWNVTRTVHSTTGSAVSGGFGADLSNCGRLLSGFGHKGQAAAGTAGDGGYGGSLITLFGYSFTNNLCAGTITNNGGAGTAGSGNAAQGGSGGAAGTTRIGALVPWKDSGTRNNVGGAGGAASGATGASTVYGGAGGGGGLLLRFNCYDTSGATDSVAGGATGANSTAGSGAATNSSVGGASYGNGGLNSGSPVVATSGQNINLNGLFDPSTYFAV